MSKLWNMYRKGGLESGMGKFRMLASNLMVISCIIQEAVTSSSWSPPAPGMTVAKLARVHVCMRNPCKRMGNQSYATQQDETK